MIVGKVGNMTEILDPTISSVKMGTEEMKWFEHVTRDCTPDLVAQILRKRHLKLKLKPGSGFGAHIPSSEVRKIYTRAGEKGRIIAGIADISNLIEITLDEPGAQDNWEVYNALKSLHVALGLSKLSE